LIDLEIKAFGVFRMISYLPINTA